MSHPEFEIDEQEFQEFQALIQQIEAAEVDNFFELARLLGRDPKTDLVGADLRGTDLSFGDLSGANLVGTDLSDANLRNTNLTGADLRDTNLTGADLSNAVLTEANLVGANLTGANLTGADLTRITRDKAILENAILEGATLTEQTLVVRPGDGTVVVSNLKGIDRKQTSNASVFADVETLKFSGAEFSAESVVLTQEGKDLVITFDQVDNTQVVFKNFLRQKKGDFLQGSYARKTTISNIVFDVDIIDEILEVSDANTNFEDVISGQPGEDSLQGFAGKNSLQVSFNDLLTGASGQDALSGGTGRGKFVVMPGAGTSIIEDFNVDEDIFQVDGLSAGQIRLTTAISGATIVSGDGTVLAIIKNVHGNDNLRNTQNLS